jgi:hypothetical protein
VTQPCRKILTTATLKFGRHQILVLLVPQAADFTIFQCRLTNTPSGIDRARRVSQGINAANRIHFDHAAWDTCSLDHAMVTAWNTNHTCWATAHHYTVQPTSLACLTLAVHTVIAALVIVTAGSVYATFRGIRLL